MKGKFNIYILVGIILFFIIILIISPSPKEVYLTFDVESVDSVRDISHIINILEKNNIQATFFITGEFANANPELVRKIGKNNEIGCHSFSHKRLNKLSYNETQKEIVNCKILLENITGKKINGFRAPYQIITREAITILEENNFSYDSSSVENIEFFWPSNKIKKISISSFGVLPLSDYIHIYLLKEGKIYFKLIKYYRGKKLVLLFHPRFLRNHYEEFDLMIKSLKKNANFNILSSQAI